MQSKPKSRIAKAARFPSLSFRFQLAVYFQASRKATGRRKPCRMASDKKARPRQAFPSLSLILHNLRTRRKLSALLLLAVAGLIWLSRRGGAVGAVAEDAAAMSKRQVRFDRERELEGLVSFPALDELVERDRMWPPDLCESFLVLLCRYTRREEPDGVLGCSELFEARRSAMA